VHAVQQLPDRRKHRLRNNSRQDGQRTREPYACTHTREHCLSQLCYHVSCQSSGPFLSFNFTMAGHNGDCMHRAAV